MGVFARLLRRSKATEEAPAAGQRTGAPAPEPASEDTADAADAAAKGSDGTDGAEKAAAAGPERSAAENSDGVEIPKQQSAGAAVDNEAGEGARS
ncbi:hypothetical protein DN402_09790 [Streptomyces sp. SW4]|nr:hypothetical protein DN402_09790 [Streptomyces sp. SW4]